MPKDFDVNILLDVYGDMLTPRQKVTLELYYEEDMSLGEISEAVKITRQGVMNCIRKAEAKLNNLEDKLGLIKHSRELGDDITALEGLIIQGEMQNGAVMAQIDELMVKIKGNL